MRLRDNLHRLAEIVSAALLVDDALVDTPGGDVVRASSVDVGETLIVTEVEVGLVAVDSHIAFAMLVGVQCARIDSKRRNHASRYEDIFRFHSDY